VRILLSAVLVLAGIGAAPGAAQAAPAYTTAPDARVFANIRGVGIDGGFGSVTEQAVRDYQSSRGLGTDSVCGSQTWGALQTGK
jgi:peptidoglycan hydrolase-like protein with peptidoglycan-binding domain